MAARAAAFHWYFWLEWWSDFWQSHRMVPGRSFVGPLRWYCYLRRWRAVMHNQIPHTWVWRVWMSRLAVVTSNVRFLIIYVIFGVSQRRFIEDLINRIIAPTTCFTQHLCFSRKFFRVPPFHSLRTSWLVDDSGLCWYVNVTCIFRYVLHSLSWDS